MARDGFCASSLHMNDIQLPIFLRQVCQILVRPVQPRVTQIPVSSSTGTFMTEPHYRRYARGLRDVVFLVSATVLYDSSETRKRMHNERRQAHFHLTFNLPICFDSHHGVPIVSLRIESISD